MTRAPRPFKIGERVSFQGAFGTVVQTDLSSDFPIHVAFDEGYSAAFQADGKYLSWHKRSSLKHVKKVPKKGGKVQEVWVNVYKSGHHYAYSHRDNAINGARIYDDVETAVRFVRAKVKVGGQ